MKSSPNSQMRWRQFQTSRAEETVEQLFRTATINAQGGTRTMVHKAVERVILDVIRTSVLEETISKLTN